MLVGILSFARVLSYMLSKHLAPTLGALVGLMLGCLRGIWPFQSAVDGVVVNVMPTAQNADLVSAVVALIVGILIVVGLSFVGSRFDEPVHD